MRAGRLVFEYVPSAENEADIYLPNVLRAQFVAQYNKGWACVIWRILHDVVDLVSHRTSIFGCGGLGRLQDLCQAVSWCFVTLVIGVAPTGGSPVIRHTLARSGCDRVSC